MPCIEYVPRKFSAESYEIIRQARAICTSYQQQGYDVTLRQLYYQFVTRDLFGEDRWWLWVEHSRRWAKADARTTGATKNADPNYKWLGSLVNDARLAGLLDWSVMVDRTRRLQTLPHWSNPAELIRSASEQFRLDRWRAQSTKVEVWIEKDALVGILEAACPELDVPFLSCRGYTSQSAMWGAAQRLGEHIGNGQDVRIIHLGDHDPSGIDMTRDIEHRLGVFIAQDQGLCDTADDPETCLYELGSAFAVERIALNADQIEQYKPPPNPAKLGDSRARGYIERFGRSSWELDALDPAVLVALVQDAVAEHRDDEAWDGITRTEESEREVLTAAAIHWTEVKELLS